MQNTDLDTSVTLAKIKQQLTDNPVILYMKGTPQFPQCGFSGQVVQILKLAGLEKDKYAYVNILENPDIRQVLARFPISPTSMGIAHSRYCAIRRTRRCYRIG